jgi:biopolymer transport protein ExbD
MSGSGRRQRSPIQANLTPMIDVTFLLIVFFVLVSQIVEVENVDLDLPAPREPASRLPGDESRVVINVLPAGGGRASGYRLGGRVFPAGTQGIEALTIALAARYSENPGLSVNLRADRTTHYLWIEPVFQAVAAAARRSGRREGAGRVNLVVTREQ